MTNTDTKDIPKTIEQIKRLEEEGCELVRVAVLNTYAAKAISSIKDKIKIPLIADIHFDYKLALEAVASGADKIRINPGNIGGESKLKQVIKICRDYDIPLRVGVNSGSLEKHLLTKYGGITCEAISESAINSVRLIEKFDFGKIIISVKTSNVVLTIKAYEMLARLTSYPLHLGVTEAGSKFSGSIKSAIGIGSVLAMGIGDTIRVSLSEDPVEEIKVAKEILKSLRLRNFGIDFISCPSCGRCEIDLLNIVKEVEHRLKGVNKNITVAIMGCFINGPGEAKGADIAIAGGKGFGFIFKSGTVIKKVEEHNLVNALLEEINNMDD